MVRQIRKLIVCLLCMLVLITALCGTVQASTHTVYENGGLSTTYITYFKDILSSSDINDNYVAFRSGQYEYSLIVGELSKNGDVITLSDIGKHYKFYTESSGYNSQYYYSVSDIDNFSLNTGNYIIYSDVGDFPELIERGTKFEIFNSLLLCVALLCVVINRVFNKR